MALRKPSSLVSFLNRWNFDVFTWKIYIGDVVENAVDWALSWVNTAYDWATTAYNWARDAWDRAGQIWSDVLSFVNTSLSQVWSRINAWWSDLAEWWASRLSYIKDLINYAREYALGLISDVLSTVNRWVTAWDDFRRSILPRLLDTSWIRSFFGQGISSIAEWWSTKIAWIRDRILAEISPVRDEVNRHTSWLDVIKGLITDPAETILGWLLKIAKAHAELLLKLFDRVMDSLWG